MAMVKMIFFVHFILLFIYCIPDNYKPDIAQNISSAYANPLFQGRWNLFAPEPPKKHKEFKYRYRNRGEWSQWIVPTDRSKKRHDFSRIGASTKMYHVMQNGAHYLWEDHYSVSADSIYSTFGYLTMKHLVGQIIEDGHFLAKPVLDVDSVQMILIIHEVDHFEDLEKQDPDTLTFPSFNYKEIE